MEYGAAGVKYQLWFIEMRETLRLYKEHGWDESIKIVIEDNLYQQKDRARIVSEFGCIQRRIQALPEDIQDFMLTTDMGTAKLIALIARMSMDKMFFEVMYEVYREKIRMEEQEITVAQVDTLFYEKGRQDETVRLYEKLGYKVFRDDGNRYMMKKDEIHIAEERITAEEYIDFLKRTDLGSQYPKERFEERIRKLVKNVSISLIARNDEGLVVGALFGLTDFCYWLYVTDLGVDRNYERQGIASKLMRTAHEIAGGEKDIAIYLIANENAIPFYEKLGMKRSDDVMQYNHIEWTEWTV